MILLFIPKKQTQLKKEIIVLVVVMVVVKIKKALYQIKAATGDK